MRWRSALSPQPSNPDEVSEREFWKKLATVRAVLVVFLLIWFVIQLTRPDILPVSNTVTNVIREYIPDGGSESWYFHARCWKLEVKLTSQYGDMRVTVVVDGRTVYDERTWSVDFETDLGYGYHEIQVAVENPTTFQPGKTILVTGYVKYWQPLI